MAGPWRPPDVVAILLAVTIAAVLLVTVTTLILIIASPTTTGEDPEYTEALAAVTLISTSLAAGLVYWLKGYGDDDRGGPDS